MKIQILSDTHNECVATPYVPVRTEADVVVLAGDIGPVGHSLRWAAEHFAGKRIIMVSGNHEAWGHEWHTLMAHLRREARQYGIDFLENDEVVIEGVRFIGACLFTDMKLFGHHNYATAVDQARQRMTDYAHIRFRAGSGFLHSLLPARTLRPEDSIRLHHHSVAAIRRRLDEPFSGPTVVVTHHAPTGQSVEPRFRNDPLSPCFASNLDELLAQHPINLWIHGHTHAAFDYTAGSTRVVCNPLGYQDEFRGRAPESAPGFIPDFTITL